MNMFGFLDCWMIRTSWVLGTLDLRLFHKFLTSHSLRFFRLIRNRIDRTVNHENDDKSRALEKMMKEK